MPDALYQAYQGWWQKRHQVYMELDWFVFAGGVVPALGSMIRSLTQVGDQVLVLSPVYNMFYKQIRQNNRKVVTSALPYANGTYGIDFNDLEAKLAEDATKLMIVCNPHNPTGQVWSKEDLERLGQLCLKHGVLIISDEIHCDLTHPGVTYTPFLALSDEVKAISVAALAPTKTFSIPGLQSSVVVIPNPQLRQLVAQGLSQDDLSSPNTFAVPATIAAFEQGEDWLEEVLLYLEGNRAYLVTALKAVCPDIRVVPGQATYLAWLDCSKVMTDTGDFCDFLRQETGLILTKGEVFEGNGVQFIRWNYACPRHLLEDGIQRFAKALKTYRGKIG